ncbi:MAG: transketolase [Bacteroidales bacterium]|nr:transketolase [Bacteroidales bacterium]
MTPLKNVCHEVRQQIIELSFKAGQNNAHMGGSLSAVEIVATLYYHHLRWNNGLDPNRDRFIMSKAHASLVQYCVLSQLGRIDKSQLEAFEQNGSIFTAHARKEPQMGLEFSGGSLGLGLSYATGVALALKKRHSGAHVYVLLGDGECDEGLVWEALMFASHHNLNNLTVIIDHNHLQADGFVEEVMNTADLCKKLQAFGFNTQQVDGHSVDALDQAFLARRTDMSNAIVAETVKGKGVRFMENKYNWHFTVLSESKYHKAIDELNQLQQ